MLKRNAPKDSSQPSMDDLQREAEAELRSAGALGYRGQQHPLASNTIGGRPRPGYEQPAHHEVDDAHFAGPDEDDLYDDDGSSAPLTAEEESRAVTGLAMQQLAERAVRPRAPQYGRMTAPSSASPEEMRTQALAEILDRQRRLAEEQRASMGPGRRQAPTVGARARAAPILTAAPMVQVARPPGVPRDSGARKELEASVAARAPVAPEAAPDPAELAVNDGQRGQLTRDAEGAEAPPRRAITRRQVTRGSPRQPLGETHDTEARKPRRRPLVSPAVASRAADSANDATLAVTSHATLSAIAVLLVSMEALPAPLPDDGEHDLLFDDISQRMKELSVLIEHYLGVAPIA